MIIVMLHILFIIASSYEHTHPNNDEERKKKPAWQSSVNSNLRLATTIPTPFFNY